VVGNVGDGDHGFAFQFRRIDEDRRSASTFYSRRLDEFKRRRGR
jgi:hypothetical protein